MSKKKLKRKREKGDVWFDKHAKKASLIDWAVIIKGGAKSDDINLVRTNQL